MSHRPSLTLGLKHEVLRVCLEDILFMLNPTEEDTLQRQNIIRQLTSIVQSVPSLTSARVKSFGSFASHLYSKWGDLDISVELSGIPNNSTSQLRKRKLLKKIGAALNKKGFGYGFQYIPLASVPILMFKRGHPAVSCDISIDNYQGCIKSKFFLWLSQIDGRFRDLVLLIKEWAKAHDINNPKSGTMNSYALCLLLIFHLQTCQPAILPPLREIYDGKLACDTDSGSIFEVPEAVIEEKCLRAARRFKTTNRDSLHELLISFFENFSGIGLWGSEYVLCPYSGKMENAHSITHWRGKSYHLLVEDPFEQQVNAARTVETRGLTSIANAFMDTHQRLSSLSTLSDRDSLLRCLARPEIHRHLSFPAQVFVVPPNDHGRVRHYNHHGFLQSRDHTRFQPQDRGQQHFDAGYQYNRFANFRVENRPSLSSSSSASSSRTEYWNQRYPGL